MKAHPCQVLIDRSGDLHRIRKGKPREIRCRSFNPSAKWIISKFDWTDQKFTPAASE